MNRANRTELKRLKKAKREAEEKLRERKKAAGMIACLHTTRANRSSPYKTVEEEQEARTAAVIEQARLIRAQLPTLLREFSRIPDPRDPKLLEHKLTSLMLYGILMFVYHNESRRKTNERFTAPAMKEALMKLFPDLESVPHHDTLLRLLESVNPSQIETAQAALVKSLIRDKKFRDYLVEGHYLIAIDGTQKLVRRQLVDEAWLQRRVGAEEKKWLQYYVYVMEASLILSNGVTIPLMSEFLDYRKGDSDREKQDCEQRGLVRLTARLKKSFPHLPIMLLLDGEFATGPAMSLMREYRWRFMIVLKDGKLPYVWQEYEGLRPLLGAEDRLSQIWGDRHQQFEFVNDIDYHYEDSRKRVTLHMVVCHERWEEVNEKGEIVERSSKWAWISDSAFSRETCHQRCNLGGRPRWGIEEGILVEKKQGYEYEHCYAEDWNAMRGYHYLMRIAHLLNSLTSVSSGLIEAFKQWGPLGFIEWVRTTLGGRWLPLEGIEEKLAARFQLRLILPVTMSPVPTG